MSEEHEDEVIEEDLDEQEDEDSEDENEGNGAPKKKGKALLFVIPLLLIGGVAGAGFMGVINIPGITPKKAKTDLYGESADLYGEQTDIPAPSPEPEPETALEDDLIEEEPEVIVEQEPELDLEAGAKKLAKVWNNISPSDLVAITEPYADEDLARVLSKMDAEIVAEFLTRIDAKKAATLSQEIESLGAVVKTDK